MADSCESGLGALHIVSTLCFKKSSPLWRSW